MIYNGGTVLEMIYSVWDSCRDDIRCVGQLKRRYTVSGAVLEMIYGVWDSCRDDIRCVGQF